MMARFLVLQAVLVCFMLAGSAARAQNTDQTRQKINELEKKVAATKPGEFDFALHNELRHLYGGIDERKSMLHCDIIFKHSVMNDYMFQCLGGKDADEGKSLAAMKDRASKYGDLPHLAAACWIRAAELEADHARALALYVKVQQIKGVSDGYRELVNDRLARPPFTVAKPWPKVIRAPKNMEKSPGPWSDPDDLTVWPNRTSRSNSDFWIAENHDRIRQMRPRLLLVNFSNEHARDRLNLLTSRLIKALAEASRYHGYKNAKSPIFLQYEVFKFVDLRDADRTKGDSRRVPVKDPNAKQGFNMKYRAYFTEEFAKHYGVPDPRDPGRFLRLDELLDGGYVHEVWFFGSGAPESPHIGAFEVVEEKPQYDEQFSKMGNRFVQAGNGGDDQQPWTGRSVRLGFVNASRGIGCFMESLSHGIEGMSNSGSIPYLTKYFRDYAGFNLKERFQLPFDSLYGVDFGGKQISYPDDRTMIITHAGKEHRVENYVCTGGNAHFPPNGRAHYDLDNSKPVLSTIEDWRMGSDGGKDRAKPFTNAAFRNYRDLAPDCMGSWLIYWRQNMPGLDNKQKDDSGKPMKNWWPFLFY